MGEEEKNPNPTQQTNEKTELTVTGPELFDQICRLGSGRFYYQKEQMPKDPMPKKEDTLGRLERLVNGKPEPAQLIFSPFAVALPVNPEETSHIIVFNDGQMALVKVFDPNREAESNEYARYFSTKYSGSSSIIEEIIKKYSLDRTKWLSLLKELSNSLYFGNFALVDPLGNDENMEIVLEALIKAKETSADIKRQREEREKEFRNRALQILNQN